MTREFDLLGDPIPDGRGQPGRTGHIATAENVNKVRVLVLAGWGVKEIAEELGIRAPTLRKHYFPNRSIKDASRRVLLEQRARTMLQLDEAAAKGNVGAQKEILRLVEALERKMLGEVAPRSEPKPERSRLGKKARRQIAAHEHASAGGKYAPPAQPKLLS